MLNPWDDASLLADRLGRPHVRLFVMIGAEQWCEKCRSVRPHFNARAADAAEGEIWLWLDLEAHAEFLGDYLPEDLPQLIVYHGAAMVICQALAPDADALKTALEARVDGKSPAMPDPGIRTNLLRVNWAA